MIFRMYTYPEIKAIAINELRDFAKEIGVKSPTTMPKEALDMAVMARLKEISESRLPSTLREVRSKAVILNKMRVSKTDRIALSGFKDLGGKEDFVLYKGYFRAYEDGDGLASVTFLPSDRDVFIEQSFVERARLMQGDFITGSAFYNAEADMFMAVSVDQVNGKTLSEKRAPYIDSLKRLEPKDKLHNCSALTIVKAPYAVCDIKKGQRILLSHGQSVDLTRMIFDWAGSLKKDKLTVLPVFLCALPEKEDSLNVLENVCVSTFDVPFKYNDSALELASQAALRYAEEGNDVVVLINNLDASESEGALNHLMGCACNLEKGSVTLIASLNEDVMDPRLYGRLLSVSDGFVALASNKGHLCVDFLKCWVKSDGFSIGAETETFLNLKKTCAEKGIEAAMAEMDSL